MRRIAGGVRPVELQPMLADRHQSRQHRPLIGRGEDAADQAIAGKDVFRLSVFRANNQMKLTADRCVRRGQGDIKVVKLELTRPSPSVRQNERNNIAASGR